MIRLLIVDDHDVLRAGLVRILEQEQDMKVVADVSDGEQAYKVYMQQQIDILIMDMSMPGQGGLETLKRIISRDKKARIIMFSAYQNTSYVTQSLNNGAFAYVTKSDPHQFLLDAIRQVAQRKHYLSSTIATDVALHNMTDLDNPAKSLSLREFEIFRLIALGHSHTDIGNRLNIGTKTVSNYQSTLKQKLGLKTPVDFVRLAMRCGVIENAL